jgi:type IV pilus assembly protein PilO
MEEFLDKFAKIPTWQKVLGMALLLGLLGFGFYQFFYTAWNDEIEKLSRTRSKLVAEEKELEKAKADILRYKEDVIRLEKEHKELAKTLPARAELPSLLEALHAEGTLIGLTITRFQPQDEVPEALYAAIPVKIELSGTYHQVLRFFYRISRLSRIVNIESISFRRPSTVGETVALEVSCVATTFRYYPPEERAAGAAKAKEKKKG